MPEGQRLRWWEEVQSAEPAYRSVAPPSPKAEVTYTEPAECCDIGEELEAEARRRASQRRKEQVGVVNFSLDDTPYAAKRIQRLRNKERIVWGLSLLSVPLACVLLRILYDDLPLFLFIIWPLSLSLVVASFTTTYRDKRRLMERLHEPTLSLTPKGIQISMAASRFLPWEEVQEVAVGFRWVEFGRIREPRFSLHSGETFLLPSILLPLPADEMVEKINEYRAARAGSEGCDA